MKAQFNSIIRNGLKGISGLLALVIFVTLISAKPIGDVPSIMVIANEKGAPSTLTTKELKAVLRGEQQWWKEGTKISIAFMKTSTPAGAATASKILDMPADQL